ncbi:hypothetical protein J6590_016323 [Homalodisca vitripennis]|nr:hypothetical protein J6590_016323 [Homalodisca vitripennis]
MLHTTPLGLPCTYTQPACISSQNCHNLRFLATNVRSSGKRPSRLTYCRVYNIPIVHSCDEDFSRSTEVNGCHPLPRTTLSQYLLYNTLSPPLSYCLAAALVAYPLNAGEIVLPKSNVLFVGGFRFSSVQHQAVQCAFLYTVERMRRLENVAGRTLGRTVYVAVYGRTAEAFGERYYLRSNIRAYSGVQCMLLYTVERLRRLENVTTFGRTLGRTVYVAVYGRTAEAFGERYYLRLNIRAYSVCCCIRSNG